MDTPGDILRYVIIDDDDVDRAVVEAEAFKFPFLQKAGSFCHPVEALEMIPSLRADILFLDIEMPEVSGMELIRKKLISAALPVLITSHPEFALESFDLDAFDYILKPVSTERFARCAYRLHDFHRMKTRSYAFDQSQESGSIVIKQGYDQYKIPVQDILYLEAMRDYTRIKTTTKQYLVLTTLQGIHQKLPEDIFIRIHRSFIVNRHRVDAIEKNKIKIQSHVLPVGKLYKFALNFSGK